MDQGGRSNAGEAAFCAIQGQKQNHEIDFPSYWQQEKTSSQFLPLEHISLRRKIHCLVQRNKDSSILQEK